MIYKTFIRPQLFKKDAEVIHYQVFRLIKSIFKIPLIPLLSKQLFRVKNSKLEKELFGIQFPNPVGLAAGFDKDAKLFEELACLGFGFIEVGTVTPKPQDGNPKPRLFRLPLDKGIINRMGFNNEGVYEMVNRLKTKRSNIIIGGNIGKNKVTPNESAVEDYLICFNALFDYVDYFVVNVSSPNTPNLRQLQEKEPLTELLIKLQKENASKEKRKPILLKIAPDLTNNQLDDIVEIMQETKLDGLIATNTTIDRSMLSSDNELVKEIGAGGLSGFPVKQRSTEVIRYLSNKSSRSFPIVAVGGIFTADDAIEKIKAGADLVQVYTGFIYEGPSMIKKINKGILKYYESRA